MIQGIFGDDGAAARLCTLEFLYFRNNHEIISRVIIIAYYS